MDEIHQQPSPPPLQYNHSKSLAIAVVVSAVFLLAAAGICAWLLMRPAGTATIEQKPTGDGSESVKTLEWTSPDSLAGTYARREQNTKAVKTTYYFDAVASCGLTTNVQPMVAGKTPKDIVLEAAQGAQAYGIATTGSTDADIHKIKDADGSHTYDFKSVQLEQTVNVAGVPYNAQRTVVAYKQFGTLVASVGYSCKADTWDAKKTELQTAANLFIVKTTK
jgi:hypothetical protein